MMRSQGQLTWKQLAAYQTLADLLSTVSQIQRSKLSCHMKIQKLLACKQFAPYNTFTVPSYYHTSCEPFWVLLWRYRKCSRANKLPQTWHSLLSILRKLQRVMLSSHMTIQELFACKRFAAHLTWDGLAVAQVNEAHVATRICRVRIDFAAHQTGHSVRVQILWKTKTTKLSICVNNMGYFELLHRMQACACAGIPWITCRVYSMYQYQYVLYFI
jgi:hypothetical protein